MVVSGERGGFAAMLIKAVNILVVVVLLVLAISIFANSMTKPIGHDEHMYCTAGALLSQGKMIYKDFSYVAQLPWHPGICALIYKLTGTTRYLLAGRLLSVVCDIGIMLSIYYIFYITLASFKYYSKLMGLGAAVWYVFNPIVCYSQGFAWNHDLVVLCVLVSLVVYLRVDFKKRSRYIYSALMGGLLAFAVWMRMTAGFAYLLFFIALLFSADEKFSSRGKVILPFLASSLAVSLWPLWIIYSAPKRFLLNVFAIPIINGKWLHQVYPIPEDMEVITYCLTRPAYLTVLISAVFLFVMVIIFSRKIDFHHRKEWLITFLLSVLFFISVFIPPTMFRQYFSMPVLFLILSFAYPLRYVFELKSLGKDKYFSSIVVTIMSVSILVTIFCNLSVFGKISAASSPSQWPANKLHNISRSVAERAKPGKILTLGPLYALEGGNEIYREFSAGAFVYRIAPFMKREALDEVNGAGPEELAKLLEEQPASAVILGIEPRPLEKPLFDMAVGDDWEKHVYEGGITVYFRPQKIKFIREKDEGYI